MLSDGPSAQKGISLKSCEVSNHSPQLQCSERKGDRYCHLCRGARGSVLGSLGVFVPLGTSKAEPNKERDRQGGFKKS